MFNLHNIKILKPKTLQLRGFEFLNRFQLIISLLCELNYMEIYEQEFLLYPDKWKSSEQETGLEQEIVQMC